MAQTTKAVSLMTSENWVLLFWNNQCSAQQPTVDRVKPHPLKRSSG